MVTVGETFKCRLHCPWSVVAEKSPWNSVISFSWYPALMLVYKVTILCFFNGFMTINDLLQIPVYHTFRIRIMSSSCKKRSKCVRYLDKWGIEMKPMLLPTICSNCIFYISIVSVCAVVYDTHGHTNVSSCHVTPNLKLFNNRLSPLFVTQAFGHW